MRLGVNGWRLSTRTGVARVILNIIRYWTPEFVAGRFDAITIYSPNKLDPDLPIPASITQRVVRPDLRMLAWENACLPRAGRDHVLLCPSYSRPLWTSARTVTLIYEATQKLFPEHYPVAARFIHTPLYGWSARNSTIVVTNTEQAREDIVRAYHPQPDKVRVVPLAPADIFYSTPNEARIAEIRAKYVRAAAPFFLYVGKLTSRRNVPRIVEALAELKRLHSCQHRLIIVGLNTTHVDLQQLSDDLGIKEHVLHYPFVADEDLAVLYRAAEAFVLPYSYESAASLTLMEAQAAGTPVITTNTPGLRQVADDAALFIPDVEVSSLARAMAQIALEPGLREDLSRRGVRNAERYSWQRSSNQMLDILREAAAS